MHRRIGAGLVRRVAAGLVFEVGTGVTVAGVAGVAGVVGGIACAFVALVVDVVATVVLAYKTLVARLDLDQGAVHAEVLVRQQARALGRLHDQGEQLDDRVVFDQAFTVLGG